VKGNLEIMSFLPYPILLKEAAFRSKMHAHGMVRSILSPVYKVEKINGSFLENRSSLVKYRKLEIREK